VKVIVGGALNCVGACGPLVLRGPIMPPKLNPIGNQYFRILIAFCGLILAVGLIAVWQMPQLGAYDPANYVEVARNLLAGRGLSCEVVGNFYRCYQSILHTEDRRASVWSLVLAGSMAVFGETEFAAALPNLLLGLLVAPVLVYLLAWQLRLPSAVCLAAGILFVAWPYWLKESLDAGADVLFTVLLLLSLSAILCAAERKEAILLSGAAVGLAYTVKPAGLLLVVPLAAYYWLDQARLSIRRRLLHLAGFAVIVLLFASPMLIRNYLAFGNPVYSTNIHTAGHIRTDASGQGLLHVYWDEPLPSLSRWLREAGLWGIAATTAKQLGKALALLFGGVGLFFAVPCVIVIFGGGHHRRVRNLWVFAGLFVLELALSWIMLPRYLLVVLPVVAISATVGGLTIGWRIWPARRYAEAGLLAVAVLVASVDIGGYTYWRVKSGDPLRQAHIEMAGWAKQQLPTDSVIMTHYPYLVRFYSDRLVVQVPFDETDAIERVGRHYGVDTVVVPTVSPRPRWARALPRRQLLELVAEQGWQPVYHNSGVVVFRPGR